MATGRPAGPRSARPTNAATAVATPVMVRLPLGISWMYTPGLVSVAGMAVSSTRARPALAYRMNAGAADCAVSASPRRHRDRGFWCEREERAPASPAVANERCLYARV